MNQIPGSVTMDENENIAGRHRFGGHQRCSPVPAPVLWVLAILAVLVVAGAIGSST
jgi:hypothetical protein